MLNIEKIIIENFKSISKAEVDFGDLTVITGVNSSGKSSLIQSILYLSQWFANSEFVNNEDEFYIAPLSVYDRYLVNKNRSYEGIKNNIEEPILLGFKNQKQELQIEFSNFSQAGLRINPEILTLKNNDMNQNIEFERFPKVSDPAEVAPYSTTSLEGTDKIDEFLISYFLGNIYFDLIGNSIKNDVQILNKDLKPLSVSSIYNYDFDEILEKRNAGNEKFRRFLKTKNQFDYTQISNLSNGLLKLSNRNFGDSYVVSNSKMNNLLSTRYNQNLNSSSLVLKETNFFLQFFISKLPEELLETTSFGSGIREREDFSDFNDSVIEKWNTASKKLIISRLLRNADIKDVPLSVKDAIKFSNTGDADSLFYIFQAFIDAIINRNSISDPLNIQIYADDYINNIKSSEPGTDSLKNRFIFDVLDELEYLITVINKELLESSASFKTEIKNLDGQLDPDYKEKFPPYVEAVNRAKESIKRGEKLNINVIEIERRPAKNKEGKYMLPGSDSQTAVEAYKELGIKEVTVTVNSSAPGCICNNQAWGAKNKDVDDFLEKSEIGNLKTYICPADEQKIHVGYFSRGEATESAEAQKFGTFFLYPEDKRSQFKGPSLNDPIDFLFDLFYFLKNESVVSEDNLFEFYFNFLYEDKIVEFLDKEIDILKNWKEKKDTDFNDTTRKKPDQIPDYGQEYRGKRKKEKLEDYYTTFDTQAESIFDLVTEESCVEIIKLLRQLKKEATKSTNYRKMEPSTILHIFFDINTVVYEKSKMHSSLENIYPSPFSEKDNFLNDLSYLSTIRDPDNQNDPVGNYSNILPIGQNAGGLTEYLTLYGDREVEPFLSPKFDRSNQPIRGYDNLSWENSEPMSLYEAVKLWLKYLGLKDFDFQVINEGTQSKIKFKGGQGVTSYAREITEIGSGIGKILPVVVNCLIAKKGQVVLIEEPETHLHPSAQTYLADFLFAMSASRQIIIETHSPNIIDRLRFRSIHKSADFLDANVKPEIEVIFSELDNDLTIFRQGTIDDLGDIIFENTTDSRPWPDGFFDNTDRDLTNILKARKEKLDKDKGE